jgi:hypothetical protein
MALSRRAISGVPGLCRQQIRQIEVLDITTERFHTRHARMPVLAYCYVSDFVSSFQADFVFRLTQAHLSRSLPRLEQSLDK